MDTWAKQRDFASYVIDLLLVMVVVSYADIWIVYPGYCGSLSGVGI